MFTGIVEKKVSFETPVLGEDGLDFWVNLGDIGAEVKLGDSIAVNGCCLTVAEKNGSRVFFHAGRETLQLTNLGVLRQGEHINMERSLQFGAPLGGHLVSGHVDGLGRVLEITAEASQTIMRFEIPDQVKEQVVLKGSIALDGVSLTLIQVQGCEVAVAVIPHTLAVTTLGEKKVGDPINVEADMIGKWILKQAGPLMGEMRALIDEGKIGNKE